MSSVQAGVSTTKALERGERTGDRARARLRRELGGVQVAKVCMAATSRAARAFVASVCADAEETSWMRSEARMRGVGGAYVSELVGDTRERCAERAQRDGWGSARISQALGGQERKDV
jgi:hypothetical protein